MRQQQIKWYLAKNKQRWANESYKSKAGIIRTLLVNCGTKESTQPCPIWIRFKSKREEEAVKILGKWCWWLLGWLAGWGCCTSVIIGSNLLQLKVLSEMSMSINFSRVVKYDNFVQKFAKWSFWSINLW